jgi:hypothetical protein
MTVGKVRFSIGLSIVFYLSLFFFYGCSSQQDENSLFEVVSAELTGIEFENNLHPREDFNMYIFRNFYNGGGVAAGDVTGDGLPDLFFNGAF